MLPTVHRLRSSADFSAATRSRLRIASGCLVVHVLSREESVARVGLVIPKAVGGSVVRHRVARRLRALSAARIAEWPQADVVIRALPAAGVADSAILGADLDRAMGRAREALAR